MRRVALVGMAAVIVSVVLASGVATISVAAPGATTRVSVSSSGVQGNRDSLSVSLSSDGRFVSFGSEASNLVPGDTNDSSDIFVRDRQTGTTQRVSVNSSGAQGNVGELGQGSNFPSISSGGRFVAFSSEASNLVPRDTNAADDVFVHQFELDTTAPKVVSVVPARGASGVPRAINLKATFSEPVYRVKANFKLYPKDSNRPVAAVITPVRGTNNKVWVLNPERPLLAGTLYTAKVRTGVVDKVGKALDQDLTMARNQSMVWAFTVAK